MIRNKNLLWISLIMMLFGSAVVASMPLYATSTTVLSAPIVLDTALGPGSTFYVDITVADVSAMWGYEFILSYDTSILTATSYSTYDPFISEWPSEINDPEGYVAVAYSMIFGELEGFSTVDPAPVARIDFTVDAEGGSFFDLHDSVVTDIYGDLISHQVVDGLFANVVPNWSANLVRRSAWAEYHSWVESKDVDLTFTGKVRNLGSVPLKAKVVFTISNNSWSTSVETDIVWITPGQIVGLTKTITVGDLNPLNPYGKYSVNARCWFDSDGDDIIDAAGAKLKSFSFTVKVGKQILP